MDVRLEISLIQLVNDFRFFIFKAVFTETTLYGGYTDAAVVLQSL